MCQFVFFIYLVFIHKWPFSAISAVVCAPTHADRRRQDILATHGYENTDWFFNMVLYVFMVNHVFIQLSDPCNLSCNVRVFCISGNFGINFASWFLKDQR